MATFQLYANTAIRLVGFCTSIILSSLLSVFFWWRLMAVNSQISIRSHISVNDCADDKSGPNGSLNRLRPPPSRWWASSWSAVRLDIADQMLNIISVSLVMQRATFFVIEMVDGVPLIRKWRHLLRFTLMSNSISNCLLQYSAYFEFSCDFIIFVFYFISY